ncbi:MAG: SufD family Fe-S cluster assembly protein [Burkholderiales bacterium]|nr:SufD family Fe-S cluster assembly protein [Burkholderiales bacterium]
MNHAQADMLAAREHLARSGWITRKTEAFRHLLPPPAELWLGDAAAAQPEAPPLELAGWTLQPTGHTLHTHTSAEWLDAADAAQRHALFAGLPLPDAAAGDDAAPFAWAHRALCRQGLRLRVEPTTGAPAPTESTWLTLQYQPRAPIEAPLAVIEIGAGVNAVLVETHGHATPGTRDWQLVQNLQLHVRLGAGASLTHLRVVEPHDDDQLAHHVHVKLARGAQYRQALIGEGSRYHLQRLLFDLEAEDASASVGTVLTASGMALDFQSYVRHLAPRTTSAVQALALARDRAQVVLNTHAHIAAGCDDANVHQLLTGIPVHGEPRLTLRPHMEILHDQVQATHGATWGALPEDALFYAQQRGIANQVARGLIVRGMASDLLTRAIDDDALSEQLNAAGRLTRAIARLLEEEDTAAPAASGAEHG